MLWHFKSRGNPPILLPLSAPLGQSGWRQPIPNPPRAKRKLQARLAHTSSLGRATAASPAPQRLSARSRSPERPSPWRLAPCSPALHHHTLLHPPPAGKSPAAGWPLSTGFVLLHEMNCCGVGVGEAGCRERSQGSGCLGVPGFAHGDRGEQLAAQLPASLALPPHQRSSPQGWIGLFVLFELWQRWRYRKPHQR